MESLGRRGRALQVTTGGGFRARESPDGSLYFSRSVWGGDVWRSPVAGGEETPILEVPEGLWWDVGEQGLYYLDTGAEPHPVVDLFDPVTSGVTRVAELEGDLGTPDAGLTVSPDGRSIFYVQADTAEQDLMLIENFR